MTTSATFAPLLERFFTQRLMQQRQASPHTISSYRDTFRQFLKFVQQRLHKPPSRLNFEDIDAPLIVAFLDELEKHQGVSVRTRNLRLAAIHSFFHYAALETPAHSAQIQRVLAIPSKRFTRTLVHFLTRPEVDALLAAPDQGTWSGRRDHAFHAGRRTDRSSPVRDDRAQTRGPDPRRRRSRAGDRERSKRALYTHRQIHTRRTESVVARTATW